MTRFNPHPEALDSHFRLNPNVRAAVAMGFKDCLRRPIVVTEPSPEFALTVPAELYALEQGMGTGAFSKR